MWRITTKTTISRGWWTRLQHRLTKTRLSSISEGSQDGYTSSMKGFHWAMAGGALACTGLVQYQQRTDDKQLKGDLMFWHKSIGLLMGMVLIPRIAV